MTYYIGFRFGWVRIGRCFIGWYDHRLYHHWPRGVRLGRSWKVWMQ